MAHGLHAMIKSEIGCNGSGKPRPGGGSSSGAAGKMGSRRIFTPQFKLQVLDSYRNDSDCKGNQRATARKYGIHRRQIQKWLQVENNLRSAAANGGGASNGGSAMKINLLSNSGNHHPPQFQLHPQLHHHHHHMQQQQHHQNLNSIELKVPMDSTRHRVAPNASNNNNNNGKESSACIISPVPTHTVPTAGAPPSSFSHPHETSSSSASLSSVVLNGKSAALAASQQVPRPNFSPVSVGGEYPGADRLHLLDQYYHYAARYAIDCPIDLSLPQQFRKVEQQALSPCSTASSVYSSRPRSATPSPQEKSDAADAAVDLSCRKRKSSEDSEASPPKSVKLFKPYLLDEKEEDKDDKDSQIDSPLPKEVGGRHDYPIIWNFHAQQRYYESLYGSEYGSGTPYGYPPSPPYPLTPIPRTPFSTLSPSPPSSSWAPPQASPVSGYDSSTSISSVYSQDGNEDTAGYSYSLELKQQAIDSYYHDVSCRGDFRAVASKFNIQRKYVEKWLAQEDHLGSQPPPPPQIVVG